MFWWIPKSMSTTYNQCHLNHSGTLLCKSFTELLLGKLLLGKLVIGEVSVGEISGWGSCDWGSCDWGNCGGEVARGK